MSAVAGAAAPVVEALRQLERDYELEAEPDGGGGAYITVKSVDIGPRWSPEFADIAFQIAFNYPFAAIYPFYASAELARLDGGPWPPALQRVGWREQQVTQISLRANRWNPRVDTAAGALAQVRHWFRERA